jgi:hypothetical protein
MIKVQLNQSVELDGCTFKPNLIKRSNSIKPKPVKNMDKVINRIKKGREER